MSGVRVGDPYQKVTAASVGELDDVVALAGYCLDGSSHRVRTRIPGCRVLQVQFAVAARGAPSEGVLNAQGRQPCGNFGTAGNASSGIEVEDLTGFKIIEEARQ